MGFRSAADMRAHATEDVALLWHLRSNHYPPLPSALLPVAKAALEHARRGEYEEAIPLPEGMTYRDGSAEVTVREAVESMHLDAFLDEE